MAKSSRKALVDISNTSRKPWKDPSKTKKTLKEERPPKDPNFSDCDEQRTLDRLLLAHSDLSNLIHQIDELIAQAFKLRVTCKMGSQEIESFMHVLSDMHSTLKPWVPRFQQAFSNPSTESDSQLGQSLLTKTDSAAIEERNDVPNYSEEPDLDSLISPSPLVSWRTDCRDETGRQPFLLTPLPKLKALSSKHPGPSKSILEKVSNTGTPCQTLLLRPLSTISRDSHDDLCDNVEFRPTPKNISKSAVALTERTSNCCFVSLKFSNHKNSDHSMHLMTPLLKVSSPRTCRFPKPDSESFQQNNNEIMKPTPLTAGVQDSNESLSSENMGSHVSGCFASKYPELLGIQLTHKSANRRQEVEASLDWFFSPPKTCILMEPPDEKLITKPGECDLFSNKDVLDEQAENMVSALDKKICSRCQLTKEPCNHGLCSISLAAPESTPFGKDLESTVRKGKQPGENTLKRELWTKFEAVSTSNVLRFDGSFFQGENGKGFIDRLEEVSCEETGLESNGWL